MSACPTVREVPQSASTRYIYIFHHFNSAAGTHLAQAHDPISRAPLEGESRTFAISPHCLCDHDGLAAPTEDPLKHPQGSIVDIACWKNKPGEGRRSDGRKQDLGRTFGLHSTTLYKLRDTDVLGERDQLLAKDGINANYLVPPQFAQELLSTFSVSLGEVALQPSTGGTFVVTIYHALPENAGGDGKTASSTVLWDRKVDGGFPETKELKRRVRDVIEPGRDLGHVDRNHGSSGKATSATAAATATATAPAAEQDVPVPVAVSAAGPAGSGDSNAQTKCEDCQ
ncbi:hypothetical protein HJFPF1_02822 [Paramyrothecium foliicola]|nr:hypothetical protein HJFPF1_02822 [Paramyrothecium foliicola]